MIAKGIGIHDRLPCSFLCTLFLDLILNSSLSLFSYPPLGIKKAAPKDGRNNKTIKFAFLSLLCQISYHEVLACVC